MATCKIHSANGITFSEYVGKRLFDIVVSLTLLIFVNWVIVLAWCLAAIDTRRNGFFRQWRIGRFGKPFKVIKIRTMKSDSLNTSTVSTANDARITPLGSILRRTKIDELPQLYNVLFGHMSLVGPRPDVPGYADCLGSDDRIILSVRPGMTGPATLKYRNEELLLAQQKDPERYNREIIFPDKVRINKRYVKDYSFRNDLRFIAATLFPRRFSSEDVHPRGR